MRAVLILAMLGVLLLAGCTTPSRPAPGSGFAYYNITMAVPENPDFPGLEVQGTLQGAGKQLTLRATATNNGSNTYRVETGCGIPWHETLYRGENLVQMRQPMARCEGFTLRDFSPGDIVHYNLTWNATVWNDASQRYAAADTGPYVWGVQFIASQPDAPRAMRFDLDFNVRVR
jgi:hypothetical protein